MKKRIFASVLVCLMLASVLCTPAFATVPADIWNDLKFSIFTQTSVGYNFAEFDTGGMLGHAQTAMRGFAVAPDGSYVFGGYLNPGNTSAVEMFDGKTGKVAGTYVHTEEDGKSISYPKGLACDDRGYLYVGLASRSNKAFATLDVVKYDEKGSDGWLKCVSSQKFITTDDNTKTGINGVAVREIAGKYMLYIVVNYDVDYLYRFDVTDPANPVVDATFGDNGRIDLQKDPFKLKEGNYLDVDDDGTIYLGCTTNEGAGFITISEDGKKVINTVSQSKGYAVKLWEGYVLVSTQSGPTCICVYDKATLTLLTTINFSDTNVAKTCDAFEFGGLNSIVGIGVANDVLYVADQGPNNGIDQVLIAPLTELGKPVVDTYVTSIAARLKTAETTAATTEAPKPETTVPETKAETTPETKAETKAETKPATTPVTEPAKSGCGSSVAAAVVVTAILGSAVVIRKRK